MIKVDVIEKANEYEKTLFSYTEREKYLRTDSFIKGYEQCMKDFGISKIIEIE